MKREWQLTFNDDEVDQLLLILNSLANYGFVGVRLKREEITTFQRMYENVCAATGSECEMRLNPRTTKP